ncbi:MAG: hypothetical protein Q8P57_04305 [Candidatus Pacearchaeota archaeon]|nr:hypothetical protein [Candidatus Pacearchaeota archaeon]
MSRIELLANGLFYSSTGLYLGLFYQAKAFQSYAAQEYWNGNAYSLTALGVAAAAGAGMIASFVNYRNKKKSIEEFKEVVEELRMKKEKVLSSIDDLLYLRDIKKADFKVIKNGKNLQ